ncbi:MAG: peptidoglycan DD-metalloendopeptidase family protein [Segetibacter sp.]|nr:peptidoglycan DD-metalloendopeptidase family protein [Segetibacter sp.]
MQNSLYNLLDKYRGNYFPVVNFDPEKDALLKMDFTNANRELTEEVITNTELFSTYVTDKLGTEYTYGIGGYNEHRTIYARSAVFDEVEEPRRLHLGIDIWGLAGTPIFCPIGGYVHSFAFNDSYGDYGATIILHHQLDGISFNTLYGHLCLRDLAGLQEGQYISRGAEFAHFGDPLENGFWPPHLHFQVIKEMHVASGDYPGVCKLSERDTYLENCPDPDVILNMMQYAK